MSNPTTEDLILESPIHDDGLPAVSDDPGTWDLFEFEAIAPYEGGTEVDAPGDLDSVLGAHPRTNADEEAR